MHEARLRLDISMRVSIFHEAKLSIIDFLSRYVKDVILAIDGRVLLLPWGGRGHGRLGSVATDETSYLISLWQKTGSKMLHV